MRRLLVVDSTIAPSSPAMRAWLRAAPDILPSRFNEVEVWGFRCDLDAPWIKFRRIPPITNRWRIQCIFYEQAVRKLAASLSPSYLNETLVQCTGTHLDRTDIRYIHFWHTAYTEAAAERPQFLKLPLKDRIVSPWTSGREKVALETGNTSQWWCVSRGIAEPIKRDSNGRAEIRCLPNSYDPTRFNHQIRATYRDPMRRHYGFEDDEVVLAFSAFGHFERKGLRQAAQAIALLRARGYRVKLIVLGGSDSTVRHFRTTMSKEGIPLDGLVFPGLVSRMEEHLSAADAFFMPSHFEAFSLAEIEAAALGLRLYLTAHPGHEMILRENINGRLLPWEPEGMARIFEEEINSGIIRDSHSEVGEALIAKTYSETLAQYYDMAIARKWSK